MKPRLSLIIPFYNASSFIEDTLYKLQLWINDNDNAELILVNDGSIDNTKIFLQNFCKQKNRCVLISYTVNKGKGFAVRQGMQKAKGEFRIFTDADIPYGFDGVDQVLKTLLNPEVDVCIGNREDDASNYHVKTSFIRSISSKIFTIFIVKLVVSKLGDTQCGLKGFNENAAQEIFSKLKINGFAFDVESMYLCHKYGLIVKRIPVNFQGNTISTINLAYSSIKMLLDVLSLPIRYHILNTYRSK